MGYGILSYEYLIKLLMLGLRQYHAMFRDKNTITTFSLHGKVYA